MVFIDLEWQVLRFKSKTNNHPTEQEEHLLNLMRGQTHNYGVRTQPTAVELIRKGALTLLWIPFLSFLVTVISVCVFAFEELSKKRNADVKL